MYWSDSASISFISQMASWFARGIQVPGRISWNWFFSKIPTSGFTLLRSGLSWWFTASLTMRYSKLWRAISASLLFRLIVWLFVRVPLWSSKYNSPLYVVGQTKDFSNWFINWLTVVCSALGKPSTSLRRSAISIISNSGPPPPSPYPYDKSLIFDTVFSLIESSPLTTYSIRLLGSGFIWVLLKWTKTLLPSSPFQ